MFCARPQKTLLKILLLQTRKRFIFVKRKKFNNLRNWFFQKFFPPENFCNLCLQKFESYIFAKMIAILLDCNWNVVLGCGGGKDSWPDGQQAHREESGEEDWESQGKNNWYSEVFISYIGDTCLPYGNRLLLTLLSAIHSKRSEFSFEFRTHPNLIESEEYCITGFIPVFWAALVSMRFQI